MKNYLKKSKIDDWFCWIIEYRNFVESKHLTKVMQSTSKNYWLIEIEWIVFNYNCKNKFFVI
jgi:hypothetical protein